MAYIPQFGPEKHEFEVRFLIRLDLIGVLKSGYGKNWILLKKSYLGIPWSIWHDLYIFGKLRASPTTLVKLTFWFDHFFDDFFRFYRFYRRSKNHFFGYISRFMDRRAKLTSYFCSSSSKLQKVSLPYFNSEVLTWSKMAIFTGTINRFFGATIWKSFQNIQIVPNSSENSYIRVKTYEKSIPDAIFWFRNFHDLLWWNFL